MNAAFYTPTSPARRWYAWLALAYLALAIYGSLVPFQFHPLPWHSARQRWAEIGFFSPHIQSRTDFAANVLLFIPLAFLAMGTLCAYRPWQVGVWLGTLLIPLLAFLSTAIEFTQLYFPPRTTASSDIIGESLGGALGVVLWLGAGASITNWFRNVGRSWSSGNLPALLLPGYVLLLLVINAMPLDLTLSPVEVYHKYKNGQVRLVPFTWPYGNGYQAAEELLWRVIFFFPVGFMLAFMPATAARERTNWRRVLALGVALAGLLECMKLFVLSRTTNTTNLFTAGAAVLAGWFTVRRWHAQEARRGARVRPSYAPAVAAAFFVWLGLVVITTWQPFNFTTQPGFFTERWHRLSLMPFADYYSGTEYAAFDQFLHKVILYMPLGAFLAFCSAIRQLRHPALPVIALGLAMSTFLEAGQMLLPGRFASVTDILVETSGTLFGFLLARKIYSRRGDAR